MLRKLNEEYKQTKILKNIYMEKTEYLVTGGNTTDLVLDPVRIRGVELYTYLAYLHVDSFPIYISICESYLIRKEPVRLKLYWEFPRKSKQLGIWTL